MPAGQGTRERGSAGRERRFMGLVRLATVGKEGKVRSVSAEGVSYQMREGKGTGRQKGSFEG